MSSEHSSGCPVLAISGLHSDERFGLSWSAESERRLGATAWRPACHLNLFPASVRV